jgi:hypothetical protein
MQVDIKIDTSAFAAAMSRFAVDSKKTSREILDQQAKLFVRDVMRITPPNKGDTRGLVRGKAVVRGDLARIFRPVSDAKIEEFRDFYGGNSFVTEFGHKGAKAIGNIEEVILSYGKMKAFHQARRTRSGKVMKVNRAATTGIRKRDLRGLDTGMVRAADFKKYLKEVESEIGKLLSGWSAAAKRLGLTVPAWVSRHGSERGEISVETSGRTLKVRITNAVKFVSNVWNLERRVNDALANRAKQMDKQVENYAVQKAAKRAGFK